MIEKLALHAAFDRVTEYWSPKVIGRVNDQLLKVAKLKGEFVWHDHAGEDELFYIVRGRLEMQFEGGTTIMEAGDLLTVPRGTRHKPVASDECWVLLIEPAETRHTGAVVSDRTRTLDQQMG